jgi:hypothetical protein
MRIRERIHGYVRMAHDVSRCWIAWCPELDILTQGDHPDHAVAMLEEATQMVIQDSVNDLDVDFEGEVTRKRVVHPLRLGRNASQDEMWPEFQEMLRVKESQPWGWFSLSELSDGLDDRFIVDGDFEIETRSGVNRVIVWFHDFAFVPSKQFAVEYKEAYSRKSRFSVRSSVLAKRPELVQELAQEHLERKKENIVAGDVRVLPNSDP